MVFQYAGLKSTDNNGKKAGSTTFAATTVYTGFNTVYATDSTHNLYLYSNTTSSKTPVWATYDVNSDTSYTYASFA